MDRHTSFVLLKDILTTIILWIYFTLGFLFFFMPIYIVSFFIYAKRAIIYQYLNSLFLRFFFRILGFFSSAPAIIFTEDIKNIKGSVVICNHRSYLDPLLLISIFPKHKTIVKGVFFKVPIFGWILRHSGYIPFHGYGADNSNKYDMIDSLKKYFSEGGNFFIFPEGTRSKNGSLGNFRKGGLRISQLTKTPISVLLIKNSEKIFRPGKFLINTGNRDGITIDLLKTIIPDFSQEKYFVKKLMNEIHTIYEEGMRFNKE